MRFILIDVDNTLLDFGRCAEESMRRGFEALGLPYTPAMFDCFTARNDALWERVERKELTVEGLYRIRWNLIFRELGVTADGEDFERRFHGLLAESHIPVEGAAELVRYLSSKYAVYVASNAPYGQQERRLALAGLAPFLSGLFVSERAGCAKPDPRFFTYCFQELGQVPREEVVLIGDSLTADVKGGIDAGIRTCWYNPRGWDCPEDCRPDWTVGSLSDIQSIL